MINLESQLAPNIDSAVTVSDSYRYAENIKNGLISTFINNVSLGVKLDTSIGAVSTYLKGAPKIRGDAFIPAENVSNDFLSLEEWQNSEYYREGIKYTSGMSYDTAKDLSILYDDIKYKEYLNSSTSGMTDGLVKFAGRIVGNIFDPINFIPILGPLNRIFRGVRYGKILSQPFIGSAFEAAGSAAIAAPFIKYSRESIGSEYTFEDAVLDIGMSAAIGSVIGYGISVGKNFFNKNKILNIRSDNYQNTVKSFSKAIDDIRSGDEVSVGESSIAASSKISEDLFDDNSIEPPLGKLNSQFLRSDSEKKYGGYSGSIEEKAKLSDLDIDGTDIFDNFYNKMASNKDDVDNFLSKYSSADDMDEIKRIDEEIKNVANIEDIFYSARMCLF